VFEVKEGHVEAWAKKLKVLMENAYPLAVPVVVEAKAGKNWGDMKELVH
jgi:DNA polymerase I-like protein with 3'-5' exonuclease and polymerase domains